MARNLGTLYYQANVGEDPKTAKVVPDGRKTEVLYDNVRYTTPLEWLAKAFSNSGKYIIHNPTVSTFKSVDTPRAKRYIPPKDRHSFGQYV